MRSLRIWIIVTAFAIVAVFAGGWFLGVQPQLAAAATSESSALTAQAQNQAIEVKLAGLAKLAATQDEMQAESKVLRKSVPSILKPNTLIRRLNELAALDGVTLQTVTPGLAAPYSPPASASVASAPAATDSTGATPTPTPTPTTAPVIAPATSSTATVAKTDPLITPVNFTVVPVTVTVKGTADAILKFSNDIQHDERVFLVNGLTTSLEEDGTVTGALSGYVYTLKR